MVFVPQPVRNATTIVNGTARLSQCVVVAGDDPAFTGGQVLARLKRERSQMSEGAGGSMIVTRTRRVRGVFYNDQLPLFGDGHNGIHIGGLAGEVHWDDRLGPWCDRSFDRFGVQIEGLQVDIRK